MPSISQKQTLKAACLAGAMLYASLHAVFSLLLFMAAQSVSRKPQTASWRRALQKSILRATVTSVIHCVAAAKSTLARPQFGRPLFIRNLLAMSSSFSDSQCDHNRTSHRYRNLNTVKVKISTSYCTAIACTLLARLITWTNQPVIAIESSCSCCNSGPNSLTRS